MKSRTLTLSALAVALGLAACGGKNLNLYSERQEKLKSEFQILPKYNSIPPEDRLGMLFLEVDGVPDIIIAPQDPLMFIEALPFYRPGIEAAIRMGYKTDQVALALRRGLISRKGKLNVLKSELEQRAEQTDEVLTRAIQKIPVYLLILEKQGLNKYVASLSNYQN